MTVAFTAPCINISTTTVAPRLPVAPASMGSSSGFLPGGQTGVRTGLQSVRGPLGAGASIESGVLSNAKGSMMINNTTVKCIVYLQMYRFRSIYYSRTLSNAPLLETGVHVYTTSRLLSRILTPPQRILCYGFYTQRARLARPAG